MGLYSTNRASTIAGARVEEVNLEGVEPDYGSVMETVIQLHECDRKMFETLIEADFMEATNNFTLDESTAMALNEENDETKKEGIGSKIKKAIEFVIEKIKQIAAAFINKIKGLFKKDEKLIAKYKDAIGKADFADFPGIKNFRAPKALSEYKHEQFKFSDVFKSGAEGIEAEKKKFTGDDYIDNFLKPAAENWKPEGNDVKDITTIITAGANGMIADIKKKTSLAVFNANQAANTLKEKDKTEDVEAKKEKFDLINKAAQFILEEFNAYRAGRVEQLKAARKAFVLLGRFTLAGKDEEEKKDNVEKVEGEVVSDEEKKAQDAAKAQEEAAIMFALGEASDIYVENVFAY